jgi:hypothetical protein
MTMSLSFGQRVATLLLGCLFCCSCSRTEPHHAAWVWAYGHAGHFDIAYNLVQTSDSGFVAAGSQNEGPYRTGVAARLSSRGDTVWMKTFPGSVLACVAATGDSGFMLAGHSGPAPGTRSAYLLRLGHAGNTLWSRTWRFGRDASIGDIHLTSDGGFFAAGESSDLIGDSAEALLVRFDAQGDTVWTRTFGGRNKDYFARIQVAADGGLYLYGITASFGSGQEDLYVVRTDSAGRRLWERAYGTASRESNGDAVAGADGSLLICGYVSRGGGRNQALLINVDAQGNEIMRRTFGGEPGADWMCGSVVRSPFGYIAGVQVNGFPGLLALNPRGDSIWVKPHITDRVAMPLRMVFAQSGALGISGGMPGRKVSADWEMFVASIPPTELGK